MPSRFASVAATAVLGVALFGAAPAFADDLPIVGTDACDTAVASAETVQSAQSTLNTAQSFLELLPATAPLEDRVAATKGVTDADEAVKGAVAEATGRLCQPPVTETPEPTTTTPTPTTTADPTETTVPAVDKDCSDFDSQEAAQTYYVDHATMSNPDPDRLDANGNGVACEGAFDEAPSTTVVTETQINNGVVVNPTADDGSVAVTSGGQVTEVPEGSAQTGTA